MRKQKPKNNVLQFPRRRKETVRVALPFDIPENALRVFRLNGEFLERRGIQNRDTLIYRVDVDKHHVKPDDICILRDGTHLFAREAHEIAEGEFVGVVVSFQRRIAA